MDLEATAIFLFSVVIRVVNWSNGVPGVTAIQPQISDDFCD
jgi:hypothetical protein